MQVTGRHVEVTNGLREYFEEKAGRLTRFYDRILSVEGVFDAEHDQFKLEIIVSADAGSPFIAQDSGPDTASLVDSVVEKLERQLRRHKEMRRDHKHDGKVEPPLD
jgi:putative sigma-54 modulation protein